MFSAIIKANFNWACIYFIYIYMKHPQWDLCASACPPPTDLFQQSNQSDPATIKSWIMLPLCLKFSFLIQSKIQKPTSLCPLPSMITLLTHSSAALASLLFPWEHTVTWGLCTGCQLAWNAVPTDVHVTYSFNSVFVENVTISIRPTWIML